MAEAEAPAKAALLEADLRAQVLADLLQAVARLWQPDPVEPLADPLEQHLAALVEVPAAQVVVVRVDPAERPAVLAAVAGQIPLRIPQMAKFPTRWLRARNPMH